MDIFDSFIRQQYGNQAVPEEPIYPIAGNVIRQMGWDQKIKEGINALFSPGNRTPRGQDMSTTAGVIEKIANYLGGAAVDQITAPFDPLASATYGGKSAKFPPKKGTFSNMADRMERFEISDYAMKPKPKFWDLKEGSVTKLDSIIEHEELFKQYPELKNIEVHVKNLGDTAGQYQGKNPYTGKEIIAINPYKKGVGMDTYIHEIQHAIQEKEGFARGGNTTQFVQDALNIQGHLEPLIAQYKKQIPALEQHINTEIRLGHGDTPYTKKKLEELIRMKSELPQMETDYFNSLTNSLSGGMKGYQRLSGEIEARDSAARMNLTGKQRQHTSPYTSEDIPLSDWITRR